MSPSRRAHSTAWPSTRKKSHKPLAEQLVVFDQEQAHRGANDIPVTVLTAPRAGASGRASGSPRAMRRMSLPTRLPQRLTFSASVDQLVLAACLFWAFSANRLFLGAALKQHGDVPAWRGFAIALVVMLVALHYLLIAPFRLSPYRQAAAHRCCLSRDRGRHPLHAKLRRRPRFVDDDQRISHRPDRGARAALRVRWPPICCSTRRCPPLLLWRARITPQPWPRATAFKLGGLVLARGRLLGRVVAGVQAVRIADARPQGSPLSRRTRRTSSGRRARRRGASARRRPAAPAARPRRDARSRRGRRARDRWWSCCWSVRRRAPPTGS